jgi:hypothetical protein
MQIYYKSLIFLVSKFDFFQFYPSMQINYRFKFHFGPNSFNFWFCFKLFNFININVWIYFNFVLQIKFITYVFFLSLILWISDFLLVPLFFYTYFLHSSYFCPCLYVHALNICFQFFFISNVMKLFYLMFKF